MQAWNGKKIPKVLSLRGSSGNNLDIFLPKNVPSWNFVEKQRNSSNTIFNNPLEIMGSFCSRSLNFPPNATPPPTPSNIKPFKTPRVHLECYTHPRPQPSHSLGQQTPYGAEQSGSAQGCNAVPAGSWNDAIAHGRPALTVQGISYLPPGCEPTAVSPLPTQEVAILRGWHPCYESLTWPVALDLLLGVLAGLACDNYHQPAGFSRVFGSSGVKFCFPKEAFARCSTRRITNLANCTTPINGHS